MNVWLSNQIGMPAANIITSLIFLSLMIVAITMIIMFLRSLNKEEYNINKKKSPVRLTICDTIAIDRVRRLVLIRRDNMEHLILIGGSTDIVVESNDVNMRSVQKNDRELHRDTPRKPAMMATNKNSTVTENTYFSTNGKTHTKNDPFSPFIKQHTEVPPLPTKVEGRKEPSLFIPTLKK